MTHPADSASSVGSPSPSVPDPRPKTELSRREAPGGARPQPPARYGFPMLATYGQRVGGFLIDIGIPGGLLAVVLIAALATRDIIVIGIVYPGAAAVGLAFLLWNSGYRQGRSGQSLGKSALGIRLVQDEHGRAGRVRPGVRAAGRALLDGIPLGPGLSLAAVGRAAPDVRGQDVLDAGGAGRPLIRVSRASVRGCRSCACRWDGSWRPWPRRCVVSGCGGPSQAGTAVIIGDDAVPLENVQTQLDMALAKPDRVAQLTAQGGSTADVARSIVTRAVLHDLLAAGRREEGITVTDAQVDAQIAENGGADALLDGSLYDVPALRERVRDNLIAAQLAQREVGGLAVTADLVAATSRADADAKAATLRAGGPAAEALFGDPQTSAPRHRLRRGELAGHAGTVLFGMPVGRRGHLPAQPGAGHLDRRAGGRPAHRRPVRPGGGEQPSAGRSWSPSASGCCSRSPSEVGIRVNPRYGVWDPIQLRVVAEDQRAGKILPPAAG